MRDLQDRIMMITGAASGIGRATALEFAAQGCHLVLCDINEEELKRVEAEIREKGRQVLAMKADVSREEDIAALADKAFSEFGRVDIAMSNAGISLIEHTHLLERADWDRIMGVNFFGTVHVIKHFLPPMVERTEGHLVITASGMGLVASPFNATYAASKFALVGLAESLCSEMALYNVGVTTLCPGVVYTKIFDAIEVRRFSRDMVHALIGGITPERFARIVVKGVKNNKGVMPISGLTKFALGIKRISPALHQWTQKQAAKMYVKKFAE